MTLRLTVQAECRKYYTTQLALDLEFAELELEQTCLRLATSRLYVYNTVTDINEWKTKFTKLNHIYTQHPVMIITLN